METTLAGNKRECWKHKVRFGPYPWLSYILEEKIVLQTNAFTCTHFEMKTGILFNTVGVQRSKMMTMQQRRNL